MGAGSRRGNGVRAAAALALLGLGAATGAHLAVGDGAPENASAARAANHVASATSLRNAQGEIARCGDGCSAVVYVWSPRMPLSREGIAEVARASERLDARLVLVRSEDVDAYASRHGHPGGAPSMPVADAMLEAGVLAHAPALLVYRDGEPLGPAILGYKRTPAYEEAVGRRLGVVPPTSLAATGPASTALTAAAPSAARVRTTLRDYDAVGTPGAYFRWVPGRDALAYESGGRVYLLDLTDGESRVAPGYIDFVPTPDGRYFVTPGPAGDGGLRFYDADEVFEATRAGRSGGVQPLFADLDMRDQYPSVGILEQEESRTVYRVLTSWFEGVVYRDYEVRPAAGRGTAAVRPLAEPVVPCQATQLSTPIISQDGLEVAARDERTGTTKIFRVHAGGRCDEVLDLGTPTSKVAWHPTGGMLAFAVPPRARSGMRPRRDESADETAGVFLYDRSTHRRSRVPASDDARLFAFPDFVGDASLVFLVTRGLRGRSSAFRVVDGVR